MHVLPATIEWQPVRGSALAAESPEADDDAAKSAVQRRASALGVQPLRWPAEFPFDSEKAMLVATYAKAIGRGVAFAQAAFRQAFAGGHSLADDDYVLIAAAACEMHPTAVVRAIGRRGVREQLDLAGSEATRARITRLPAVRIGARIFLGERGLDRAAAHRAEALSG
jgi:2-hydroxychromene-2-carboxylate isomerase